MYTVSFVTEVFHDPCSFLLADKTIKLWKISERDKRPEGYNLKEEDGRYRDLNTVTTLRVCTSCFSLSHNVEHVCINYIIINNHDLICSI